MNWDVDLNIDTPVEACPQNGELTAGDNDHFPRGGGVSKNTQTPRGAMRGAALTSRSAFTLDGISKGHRHQLWALLCRQVGWTQIQRSGQGRTAPGRESWERKGPSPSSVGIISLSS